MKEEERRTLRIQKLIQIFNSKEKKKEEEENETDSRRKKKQYIIQ